MKTVAMLLSSALFACACSHTNSSLATDDQFLVYLNPPNTPRRAHLWPLEEFASKTFPMRSPEIAHLFETKTKDCNKAENQLYFPNGPMACGRRLEYTDTYAKIVRTRDGRSIIFSDGFRVWNNGCRVDQDPKVTEELWKLVEAESLKHQGKPVAGPALPKTTCEPGWPKQ